MANENVTLYNLIGVHITTYDAAGAILHDGVILGDNYDIKMKLNATGITHSNSKHKIGWVQGLEDISGTLTLKDTAMVDQAVQDIRNGALAVIHAVGKVAETGTPNPIWRLDGVEFTGYDNKYQGVGKETDVSVPFEAMNFVKITPQIRT